jgi:hypothetical protein
LKPGCSIKESRRKDEKDHRSSETSEKLILIDILSGSIENEKR